MNKLIVNEIKNRLQSIQGPFEVTRGAQGVAIETPDQAIQLNFLMDERTPDQAYVDFLVYAHHDIDYLLEQLEERERLFNDLLYASHIKDLVVSSVQGEQNVYIEQLEERIKLLESRLDQRDKETAKTVGDV